MTPTFDEWWNDLRLFADRIATPASGPSKETRRRLREAILALLDNRHYDDHNVLVTTENHVTAIVPSSARDALMAKLSAARTPMVVGITQVQPSYWRSYEISIAFADRPTDK